MHASQINLISKASILAITVGSMSTFSTLAAENASDPTAALNFTDVKVQSYDTGSFSPLGDDRTRFTVEGAYIFNPRHKMTYELNYWDTDISGSDESEFESLKAKYINLTPGMLDNGIKYKFAVGVEGIADFGNVDKGIGTGTSQIAPLIGAGWILSPDDMVITLVQYFHSIDEDDHAPQKVRTTGPRVIWIHSFKEYRAWLKVDNKFSIDHENSEQTGNTLEVQLGKMFTPAFGVYVEGLYGTGGERIYDNGIGVGMRFMY